MKLRYTIAFIALLISLFIYTSFRTEQTLINKIFIFFSSQDDFHHFQNSIKQTTHLPDWVIYSLPQGLWVLASSILSSDFFIYAFHRKFYLIFFPLIFCFVLELFQLFHISNGSFDLIDLGFTLFFWLLSYMFFFRKNTTHHLFPLNLHSSLCIFSILTVYLAHHFI